MILSGCGITVSYVKVCGDLMAGNSTPTKYIYSRSYMLHKYHLYKRAKGLIWDAIALMYS